MEKINYSQFMHEKKYSEAAIVAFRSGYNQLFINVMEKINSPFNGDVRVQFEGDELMIDEKDEEEEETGMSDE